MIREVENIQRICLPFLEKDEIETLLTSMRTVTVKKGEALFRSGDEAAELYFLLAGRLAVQKFTGFADRTQVVGLLDPGAPVGEAGILEGQRREATVVAVREAELLSLSRPAFEQLSQEKARLTVKLLKWLLGRTSLRLKKSSERLAHVL